MLKQRKPDAIIAHKVRYTSHLKRLEKLMSSESPTSKYYQREKQYIDEMRKNSHRIHKASRKHQFGLRLKKEEEFKSKDFNKIKSVIKPFTRNEYNLGLTLTHNTWMTLTNSSQNGALNNYLTKTIRSDLGSTWNPQQIQSLRATNPCFLGKLERRDRMIEKQNQKIMERLLKVKPQIVIPHTDRKSLRDHAKLLLNKNHNILSTPRKWALQHNSTDYQDASSADHTYESKMRRSILGSQDMFKLFQSSKVNYGNHKKKHLGLKLTEKRSSKESSSFNRAQKLGSQSIKIYVHLGSSFFDIGQFNPGQRQQSYYIEASYNDRFTARSIPIVLEDIVNIELGIKLSPSCLSYLKTTKQQLGLLCQTSQASEKSNMDNCTSLKVSFVKILSNKSLSKGYFYLGYQNLRCSQMDQVHETQSKGREEIQKKMNFQNIEVDYFQSNGKRKLSRLPILLSCAQKSRTRKQSSGNEGSLLDSF